VQFELPSAEPQTLQASAEEKNASKSFLSQQAISYDSAAAMIAIPKISQETLAENLSHPGDAVVGEEAVRKFLVWKSSLSSKPGLCRGRCKSGLGEIVESPASHTGEHLSVLGP
jgi:hypothetical protein